MIGAALLVFCSVFMFKLPFLRDSAVVASLLSLVYIVSSNRLTAFVHYILDLDVLRMFLLCIALVVLYTCVIVLLYGVNDVSFLFSKILQLFYVIIVLPVIYMLALKGVTEKEIVLLMIMVFSIQSIIQVSAMLSPAFKGIVSLFQYEESKIVASTFNGIRGNALSANLFFGLSSSYGLALILCSYYLARYDENKLFISCLAVFIFFSGLLAGRTVFIALFFSVLTFFLLPNARYQLSQRLYLLSKILIAAVLFLITMVLITPANYLDSFVSFAFEFLVNFFQGKGVSTASTDRLFEMLSINVGDSYSYLFGCGWYTGFDGKYFMHTDSGYMRNILFFGLTGLFLMLINYVIFIMYIPIKRKVKEHVFLFSVISTYCAVLHIKGEVFFHMHMMTIMIFFLLVFFNTKISKELTSEY